MQIHARWEEVVGVCNILRTLRHHLSYHCHLCWYFLHGLHQGPTRIRARKTLLAKKSGVEVGQEGAKTYTKVELMDPMVEEYCKLCTKGFSKCIGFDGRYLPCLLTNHVLLNPMFGLQSQIVCSDLLWQKTIIWRQRWVSDNTVHLSFLTFYLFWLLM